MATGLVAALAACQYPYPPGGTAASPGAPVDVSRPGTPAVAILLPLTGPQADLGQNMLRAAQLSYAGPMDVRDTLGTPDGAAAAAQAAVAAGGKIILGPLTSGETAAVAPAATAAHVPVLAFTSDPAQARPGIWVLGITPDQQVRRLVAAVAAEGKTRFAAVVPDNPLGRALAAGLRTATADASLPPPDVQTYAAAANLPDALRTATDYAHRRGDIEARQKAALANVDPNDPGAASAARAQADAVAAEPVPPPPFDALLLGAVGDQLGQVAPLLARDDVKPTDVRVVGPQLWAQNPAVRSPDLAGAWFVAPDPALRASFLALYTGKYNAPPRDIADLAYDAGTMAKAAAADPNALFRPDGFAGADGPVVLRPDGQTRRGLAVFQATPDGPRLIQPSPTSLTAPGT